MTGTDPAMTQPIGRMPATLFMDFIVSLLTPFLTTGPLTDPKLARRAAEETIAAYNATGQHQLITVAQIIAFALTALDNLRLSLPEDLSPSMKLKLRGNANALNRSSSKATATLNTQIPARPEPPPPQKPDRQTDQAWASAMTDIAAEFTAELPSLPPEQRRTHLARIGALSEISQQLATGTAPPLKARLLSTTSLHTISERNLTPQPPPLTATGCSPRV